MVNVLGGSRDDLVGGLAHVLALDPGLRVQLYGKAVVPESNVARHGDGGGWAADRSPRLAGRAVPDGSSGMKELPVVGIVMGSDSDWPVMSAAAQACAEFGVGYEADVVSAHRMPEDTVAYGRGARDRGLKVIIAGAGGAAHLPGILAALTPLPVIGVPVPLKHLDGLDSLLSIVQMPSGVPVATVGVGNARNAGLLAVRILAAADPALAEKMVAFQEDLRAQALAKGAAVRGN